MLFDKISSLIGQLCVLFNLINYVIVVRGGSNPLVMVALRASHSEAALDLK